MSNIKINDLNESKTVDAQEAADVKGGPAFMKLGDIKGEATDTTKVRSEQITLGYTEVEWTY